MRTTVRIAICTVLTTIATTFHFQTAPAFHAALAAQTQSLNVKQAILNIQIALRRLPSYGVFDFLTFELDRGTVTLMGYAYQEEMKADAARAVARVAGVDEVVNNIEVLPGSPEDDRIRWATFYRIYTDNFLSRYAPRGAEGVVREFFSSPLPPTTQPVGNYPIHIIVKGRRTTLMGVVANESDKTMVSFRAREVNGVFGVENELLVRQ
jgi:hypothetical protein